MVIAMIRLRVVLLIGFLVGGAADAKADEDSAVYPLSEDVSTIDGIMRAFYEVVSTPAGESPNRARDASLHGPGAQIRLSRPKSDTGPTLILLSIDELYAQFGGPRQEALFEREVNRVTQRFGSIAHVWSTYVTSSTPNGPAIDRGISSLHLYFDGKRWWITGWIDDGERPGNQIPDEFLPPAP